MGQITTTYRGGTRFYVDPDSKELARGVPGVTSIVGMLPKPFLQGWNAKMVAELAVNMVDSLPAMIQADRQGAIDYLKGAARRYTKIRADIGSEAHDVFERMIRGEYVGPQRPDIDVYRRQFDDFLSAVNPELVRAEDVAWSDQHQYAGSFDALLHVWVDEGPGGTPMISPDRRGDRHLAVADWKTSKSTYPDVALQMSAYAHVDRIIDPEGVSAPMPSVDAGMVLHITPDQWALKPVRIDDEVFEHFLELRRTFEWDRELSRRVIGKPLASSKGRRLVTGTQRRAR